MLGDRTARLRAGLEDLARSLGVSQSNFSNFNDHELELISDVSTKVLSKSRSQKHMREVKQLLATLLAHSAGCCEGCRGSEASAQPLTDISEAERDVEAELEAIELQLQMQGRRRGRRRSADGAAGLRPQASERSRSRTAADPTAPGPTAKRTAQALLQQQAGQAEGPGAGCSRAGERLAALYARQVAWKARSEAKCTAARVSLAESELRHCSFSPRTNPPPMPWSQMDWDAPPPGPPPPRSNAAAAESEARSRGQMARGAGSQLQLRVRPQADSQPTQCPPQLFSGAESLGGMRVAGSPSPDKSSGSQADAQEALKDGRHLASAFAPRTQRTEDPFAAPSEHAPAQGRTPAPSAPLAEPEAAAAPWQEDGAFERLYRQGLEQKLRRHCALQKQLEARPAQRRRQPRRHSAVAAVGGRLQSPPADHSGGAGGASRVARTLPLPTGMEECTFRPETNVKKYALRRSASVPRPQPAAGEPRVSIKHSYQAYHLWETLRLQLAESLRPEGAPVTAAREEAAPGDGGPHTAGEHRVAAVTHVPLPWPGGGDSRPKSAPPAAERAAQASSTQRVTSYPMLFHQALSPRSGPPPSPRVDPERPCSPGATLGPRLDFGDFLQRQRDFLEAKDAHCRRARQSTDRRHPPAMSPGSRRIVSQRAKAVQEAAQKLMPPAAAGGNAGSAAGGGGTDGGTELQDAGHSSAQDSAAAGASSRLSMASPAASPATACSPHSGGAASPRTQGSQQEAAGLGKLQRPPGPKDGKASRSVGRLDALVEGGRQRRQEWREAQLKAREAAIAAELTFKPQLVSRACRDVPPKLSMKDPGAFLDKHTHRLQELQKKREEALELAQREEMEQCTFKPQTRLLPPSVASQAKAYASRLNGLLQDTEEDCDSADLLLSTGLNK